MILDNNLLFSNAQAITSTADSSVLDLGVARNLGIGEQLFLFVLITEAFADGSGTDATCTISLNTDDNASLSSDTARRTLFTISHGATAGTIYYIPLTPETYERYAALVYTVANGPFSTGKITAGIVKDIQAFTAYAAGYSVS